MYDNFFQSVTSHAPGSPSPLSHLLGPSHLPPSSGQPSIGHCVLCIGLYCALTYRIQQCLYIKVRGDDVIKSAECRTPAARNYFGRPYSGVALANGNEYKVHAPLYRF